MSITFGSNDFVLNLSLTGTCDTDFVTLLLPDSGVMQGSISSRASVLTGSLVIQRVAKPVNNVVFDCAVKIRANDAVARASAHAATDALEFNGVVYPFILAGRFSLRPKYITNVADSLDLTGSLTGTFVDSVVFSAGSLQFIGSLTGDVTLSTIRLISNYIYPDVHTSNWVAWSKIGDVTIGLDLTNDSGFKPMDWPGELLNILQLGKSAILYGTGGVTKMYPVNVPMATFGFVDMKGLGLGYKLAVAGDDSVHYFISHKRELIKVEEKGITVLGYEEMLSSLREEVVLTWDRFSRRLYIADGITGLILTGEGLGGGFNSVTGVYQLNTVNLLVSPTPLVFDGIELITDILTFKSRVLKTITKVSIETDCRTAMYCSIGYRIHRDDDFVWTTERLFNREGIATIACSGIEFQIKIRNESYSECLIDEMYIRYKLTDKRHRFEYNPNALYAGGNKIPAQPSEV